jgi:hypothetical protein
MAQAGTDFNTILGQSLATLPSDASILIPLYEAYRAAHDAMLGVLNMPRTNGAGADILEDEIDLMSSRACAVAVKLSGLTTVDGFWRDLYIETMMSHVFFIGDDPLQALAKASAVPVDEQETAH